MDGGCEKTGDSMTLHIAAVEDVLPLCHVCLFLSPKTWLTLRTTGRRLQRRLQLTDLQLLFAWQLQGRLASVPSAGLVDRLTSAENGAGGLASRSGGEEDSLLPVLHLASTVEAVVEVVRNIAAHPRLIGPKFTPVRQAIAKLHRLALNDCQLRPRERTGRRSSLSKRLLRQFAGLSGLMPALVTMMDAFPLGALPPDVFIATCEVLASLIHNSKDAKRSFIASGGLSALLEFLRLHPGEAEVQAGGLATLLALSARSVSCIQLMVQANTHEVVAIALQNFPSENKVLTRATGLLANMSNVPCVCPVLQRCGIFAIARDILLKQGLVGSEEASMPFLREFAQYLLSNLEDGAPAGDAARPPDA